MFDVRQNGFDFDITRNHIWYVITDGHTLREKVMRFILFYWNILIWLNG